MGINQNSSSSLGVSAV